MKQVKKCSITLSAYLITVLTSFSQVTGVRLVLQVPLPDTGKHSVYVAGNFNHWHAGDSLYQLAKTGEGMYSIVVPVIEGKLYEYKYARGGWDRVELSAADTNIVNRRFIAVAGLVQQDKVVKWKQPVGKTSPAERANVINARLDTLKAGLQSRVGELTAGLKSYVLNMLSDDPKKSIHNKLDRRGAKELGEIYKKLTGLVWDVMTQLPSEEKKRLHEFLSSAEAQKDFVKAFGKVLDGSVQ